MEKLGPYLLGPNDENQGIYTGDAKELAKAIPDESVDLIFTDPVYQNIEDYEWLAKTATRILKPSGDLLVYTGSYWLDKNLQVMNLYLTFRWKLTERMLNAKGIIWHYKMFTQTKPLIWMTKGEPRKLEHYRVDFLTKISEGKQVNHPWSKGLQAPLTWIERFGCSKDIILDPFVGGGTVPAVCKMLGHKWLAFEINPETAELARQRVAQTQPPLFVPGPQQLKLSV